MKWSLRAGTALALAAVLTTNAFAAPHPHDPGVGRNAGAATATPIQHVVVIFDENITFDHYFGTYPNATNPSGEPAFTPLPDTPSVNGLSSNLLANNPNLNNPQRLDRSQALTCDMDHKYADEQLADDHGLMDQFVQHVAGGSCTDKSIVMDYYDGNTVTALWNYAQHFAMSDNSFGTTFGPSTPGALNLVSGQTHGATASAASASVVNGTIIGDLDPSYDDCSAGTTLAMSGKNVGDLLNAQNITWGWFQGGFAPSASVSGVAQCKTSHQNIGGATVTDYSAHHNPFEYYQSTSNPHHLPPTSIANVGKTDQANHQYDLTDFYSAASQGYLPAVSFVKAAAYQDGHAGYSDPLDEQQFLVHTINFLEGLPTWSTTAVIIAYDDSDGWYDHVLAPVVSQSNDSVNDGLAAPGSCGTPKAGAYLDRCGYGPRLPLLVISPYSRPNFVDHSITDQSSILRFIEDNWNLGRIGDQSFDALAGPLNNMFDFSHGEPAHRLVLDPSTGEVAQE